MVKITVTTYGDYDAWQRHALISIDDGTSAVTIHAKTSSINLEIGERAVDIIELLNMGQIMKYGPVGLTTVTFEGYVLEAGSATGATEATGVWDIFADIPLSGGTQPLNVSISNNITRYRVSVLFTNDSAADQGSDAVTSGTGYKGMRFVMADCCCTSNPYDFGDGVNKFTLGFKGRAFSAAAAALIKLESGKDSTPIIALTAYTPGTTYW